MSGPKYADNRTLGRSKIAPYRPNEEAGDRHARRLQANLEARARLDAWLATEGLRLAISNEGHHWRFLRPDGSLLAQWWPSSAKLVYGAEFSKSIHCHDVDLLRGALVRRMAREAGAR